MKFKSPSKIKSEKAKQKEIMSFRIAPEQKNKLSKIAKSQNLTLSNLIQAILDDYIDFVENKK